MKLNKYEKIAKEITVTDFARSDLAWLLRNNI